MQTVEVSHLISVVADHVLYTFHTSSDIHANYHIHAPTCPQKQPSHEHL